jgi:hypothetical protein
MTDLGFKYLFQNKTTLLGRIIDSKAGSGKI